MSDQPAAAGLLDMALKTFKEDILPNVAPEKRYSALMIANALSIAGRELTELEDQALTILKSLQTLLGEEKQTDVEGRMLYQRIDALEHKLCDEIAQGKYDDNRNDLMACLKTLVHARLAISNPKILATSS